MPYVPYSAGARSGLCDARCDIICFQRAAEKDEAQEGEPANFVLDAPVVGHTIISSGGWRAKCFTRCLMSRHEVKANDCPCCPSCRQMLHEYATAHARHSRIRLHFPDMLFTMNMSLIFSHEAARPVTAHFFMTATYLNYFTFIAIYICTSIIK